jgi:hypothetical protein
MLGETESPIFLTRRALGTKSDEEDTSHGPSIFRAQEKHIMKLQRQIVIIGCLWLLLAQSGCMSVYSHLNRPLQANEEMWPDCRATAEIQQPRGKEDVLVILCLSGGGSRAAWFSAATMLRLESVVDEINLLHEVDVISSVSGGSLPAAYYCLSRDPSPYSVVRMDHLPERLPSELASAVKMDPQHGLLGVRGKMTIEEQDLLRPLFTGTDQSRVDRLYWLSHHTHAPELWQPATVRDLMTRNYINKLLWAVCVPRWQYWCTAYDRSDMMAEIFVRHLFGNTLLDFPRSLKPDFDPEAIGWLDRSLESEKGDLASATAADDMQILRWPKAQSSLSPVRLGGIPGYSLAQSSVRFAATDVVGANAESSLLPIKRRVSYRFKDLNPERPYLILNATNGTEDDPDEPHFGQVFPFTREEFKQQLDSSLESYPVAWGVMASAAFPAVFSFVTLRDFRPSDQDPRPRYMHVFDGGNADNLGLTSAKKIILANRDRYRHFVVLLVDSQVSRQGAARHKPDVRTRIVDMNFMSTFNTLLDNVRHQEVAEFESGVLEGQSLADKLTFWHISFDGVRNMDLRAKANQIPTNFKIEPKDADFIEQCVSDLVRPDHPKLQEFLRVLNVPQPSARTKQEATRAALSSRDARNQTDSIAESAAQAVLKSP